MNSSNPKQPLADRYCPTRMCIACGLKTDSRRLVRLVRMVDGSVALDWQRVMKGRGAHVCLSTKCLNSAMSRRLFDRAFRKKVAYSKLAFLLDDFDRIWRLAQSRPTDDEMPFLKKDRCFIA